MLGVLVGEIGYLSYHSLTVFRKLTLRSRRKETPGVLVLSRVGANICYHHRESRTDCVFHRTMGTWNTQML